MDAAPKRATKQVSTASKSEKDTVLKNTNKRKATEERTDLSKKPRATNTPIKSANKAAPATTNNKKTVFVTTENTGPSTKAAPKTAAAEARKAQKVVSTAKVIAKQTTPAAVETEEEDDTDQTDGSADLETDDEDEDAGTRYPLIALQHDVQMAVNEVMGLILSPGRDYFWKEMQEAIDARKITDFPPLRPYQRSGVPLGGVHRSDGNAQHDTLTAEAVEKNGFGSHPSRDYNPDTSIEDVLDLAQNMIHLRWR